MAPENGGTVRRYHESAREHRAHHIGAQDQSSREVSGSGQRDWGCVALVRCMESVRVPVDGHRRSRKPDHHGADHDSSTSETILNPASRGIASMIGWRCWKMYDD